MPVYEYVCQDCKKAFEVVRSITKGFPKTVSCPKCKSKHVEKRWSSVFVKTSRKS